MTAPLSRTPGLDAAERAELEALRASERLLCEMMAVPEDCPTVTALRAMLERSARQALGLVETRRESWNEGVEAVARIATARAGGLRAEPGGEAAARHCLAIAEAALALVDNLPDAPAAGDGSGG